MSRYQILEQLAEGSAADVVLAREKDSNCQVILEIARAEVTSDQKALCRLVAEANIRRHLAHPNIAKRVGYGKTPDGRPFWVTEPLAGAQMRRIIGQHGPFAVKEIVRVMIPLVQAIEYLHQNRSVHGNIRPENIYVGGNWSDPQPKLLDSGISLFRIPSALANGRVLVPPEYLSPERIRGRRATESSDIYALGLLMFEMSTGFNPFVSDNVNQTKIKQLCERPPPVPASCQALAPIINRCTAKDAVSRYANAAELLDALVALTAGGSVDGMASPPQKNAVKSGDKSGQILGSYILERKLGEGAMGQVYLARHTRLDRVMAIKILLPEHAQNTSFVERFFQEARAANKINHEHIVQIFDFVQEETPDGPVVYFVMELLEGKSLDAILKQGPLPLSRAIPIFRQICGALAAAHRVGVIHRDVKPDNIFVLERGDKDYVKVLDFGVAKLRSEEADQAVSLTLHGQVVGTPAYMAPEQALGKQVDSRTDIYAMGSLIYRSLVGRAPFQSRDLTQMLIQLIGKPPMPLPDRNIAGELIPESLRSIVYRCLEKKPSLRPQTMNDLGKLLASVEVPRGANFLSSEMTQLHETPVPNLGEASGVDTNVLAMSVLTDEPPETSESGIGPSGLELTRSRRHKDSPQKPAGPSSVRPSDVPSLTRNGLRGSWSVLTLLAAAAVLLALALLLTR